MARAAFLTYNSVGEPGTLRTGWHNGGDHLAFIGQNSKGLAWGATTSRPPIRLYPDEPLNLRDAKTEEDRQDMIAFGKKRTELVLDLYSQLSDALETLDHLVVYVGAAGSSPAIALASRLPAGKITFVMCDCNLAFKRDLIERCGLADAQEVICECGGQRTMHKLFQEFMQTGNLQSW